jgi:hypothetical protein
MKPDWRVEARNVFFACAMALQLGHPPCKPCARTNGAHVERSAHQRCGECSFVILPIVREDSNSRPRVDPDSGESLARIAAIIVNTGKGRRARSARRNQHDLPAQFAGKCDTGQRGSVSAYNDKPQSGFIQAGVTFTVPCKALIVAGCNDRALVSIA